MTGIVMPNGERYRISSVRRYLVVKRVTGEDRWTAVYRTDDQSRALARWRHELRYHDTDVNVIDTKFGGGADGPAVIR